MSNNFFDPNDATQAVPPNTPNPGQPQGPQGKLVLGNFQNPEPPSPQRRPYQYPPQQSQQPPNPQGTPPRTPQGPNMPPRTPQGPNMPPPNTPRPAGPPNMPPQQQGQYGRPQPPVQPQQPYNNAPRQQAPGTYPDVKRNPNVPPGANVQPIAPVNKPRRRNKGCAIGCGTVLVLLLIVIIFGFITVPKVLAFGSAISTKAPLSSDANLLSTADRTNLLIMGYGGGTHSGANLTDSLVVMSLLPQSHHTSIISVPRDLWVSDPTNPGQRTKINSIYEFASNNGQNITAGGDAAAQKISLVTGINVKYWLTIDFTGFKKVIDSIGGVDVNVPDSFNACYPKNDDAAQDASWIKVEFTKGLNHMTGDQAIQYARAREPLEVCGMGTSENLAELTDFGRSARQQIIIKAALAKVKQTSTWFHLFDAMSALQQTIHTNMSLEDLGLFAQKMDLNDPKAAHIGLSNQNVLQDSQSDDGQYILMPMNNDWTVIPPYIQQNLYK